MTTQELILEARRSCENLVGSSEWHDAVEDKINDLAENEVQADEAIMKLNNQLFKSIGVI